MFAAACISKWHPIIQSQNLSEARCDVQARWQVSKHIRSRYFNNLDATEAYIKAISHLHDTYLIRVGHPLCAESKQPPCGLYS